MSPTPLPPSSHPGRRSHSSRPAAQSATWNADHRPGRDRRPDGRPPTLSETGSGGTLPAATYYCVVTESNGFGETTAGPASTGQAITLGQDLVVYFPVAQERQHVA